MNYKEIMQDLEAGKLSPLKAYGIMKQIKVDFEKDYSEVYELAKEYAKDYEKNFEAEGFTFEKRNGAKQWDFKHIQEWQEINAKKKAIEDKYKSAYNLRYGANINAVTEDAEVLELPVLKYREDSLIIKF